VGKSVVQQRSDIELLLSDNLEYAATSILDSSLSPPLIYAEVEITDNYNAGCRFCNQSCIRHG